MKRKTVREWTCDRCGKTVDKDTTFRPLEIGKSRVRIEVGLYYYKNKRDLCSDCANGLAEMIDNYLRGEKNDRT